MRSAILATLLILPSAAGMELTFTAPYQFEADTQVANATAIAIVWPQGADIEIHLSDLDVASADMTEATKVHATAPADIEARDYKTTEAEPVDPGTSHSWTLRANGGWGSIVLEADQATLDALADGRGRFLGETERLDADRGHHPYPIGTYFEYGIPSPGRVPVVLLQNTTTDFPFHVAAFGLRTLQLHNVTITCHSSCPPSPGYSHTTQQAVLGHVTLHRYEYLRVEFAGGALAGTGAAWTAFAAGHHLQLDLAGRLRLVQAECVSDCPDWSGGLQNNTLVLEGNSHVANLRSDTSQRIQASLDGQWEGVRIDESVELRSPLTDVPFAVAVAVGAAIVLKLLAALFSRNLQPSNDPNARQAVLGSITQNPGIRHREIMAETGLPNGQVAHHLKILCSQQRVQVHRRGQTKHYFPDEALWQTHWKAAIALRDSEARDVLQVIRGKPERTQGQILSLYQCRGWGRARLQRRIQMLVWAGLVDDERDGRHARYRVTVDAGDLPTPIIGLLD